MLLLKREAADQTDIDIFIDILLIQPVETLLQRSTRDVLKEPGNREVLYKQEEDDGMPRWTIKL